MRRLRRLRRCSAGSPRCWSCSPASSRSRRARALGHHLLAARLRQAAIGGDARARRSTVPPLDDPALVLKGAGHYDVGCRPCHGTPERRPPAIPAAHDPASARSAAAGRALDARASCSTIVTHGIKFTGMPAWPARGARRRSLGRRRVPAAAAGARRRRLRSPRARRRTGRAGDAGRRSTRPRLRPPSIRLPTWSARAAIPAMASTAAGASTRRFLAWRARSRSYLRLALSAYASGGGTAAHDADRRRARPGRQLRAIADHYARAGPARRRDPRPGDGRVPGGPGTSVGARRRDRHALASRRRACRAAWNATARPRPSATPRIRGSPASSRRTSSCSCSSSPSGRRGGSPYAHLMQRRGPAADASTSDGTWPPGTRRCPPASQSEP